jgi:hypothetical protein
MTGVSDMIGLIVLPYSIAVNHLKSGMAERLSIMPGYAKLLCAYEH